MGCVSPVSAFTGSSPFGLVEGVAASLKVLVFFNPSTRLPAEIKTFCSPSSLSCCREESVLTSFCLYAPVHVNEHVFYILVVHFVMLSNG